MVATGQRTRSVLEVTGKNGGMPGPARRMVRVPASDGRRHLAAPRPRCRKALRRTVVVVNGVRLASFAPAVPIPPLASRNPAMTQTTGLQCSCGQVCLEVEHPPIVSTECHCNSCRAAGARLQALPEAPAFMESNGGTRFLLYRKDRVRFRRGSDLLREFRLTPGARTRRAVASCCNTPVFLEFQNGHWLSLYGCLWGSETPAPQLRTMTADLRDGAMLADDIPNAKRQSLSFFAKLMGAWIAMGFRSPKIPVYGELRA